MVDLAVFKSKSGWMTSAVTKDALEHNAALTYAMLIAAQAKVKDKHSRMPALDHYVPEEMKGL